jgi:hypothetical protein
MINEIAIGLAAIFGPAVLGGMIDPPQRDDSAAYVSAWRAWRAVVITVLILHALAAIVLCFASAWFALVFFMDFAVLMHVADLEVRP